MQQPKRVAYYYKDEVANYSYGEGHPMKPYRIRLAHELISAYSLLPRLDHIDPVRLSKADMLKFHAEDFIDFLREVQPQQQATLNAHKMRMAQSANDSDDPAGGVAQQDPGMLAQMNELQRKFTKYGVDGDCPIFQGLYDYCEIYSGGSVGGALKLNRGQADIAINWAGGLHHAKKAEVSGFCYTNDIVLAILELLRYHARVLYIDIDVHHGDGVEEAFYTTDRVMSVSFHNHGQGFFPQTGALTDTGEGAGKGYSLNFPLAAGIDDQSYAECFRSVITAVMASYRPGAIVLQCGADSLTGDKLGPFNLTLRGHGSCVELCKSFGVPLLLLGGGGYTVKNVARAWAYETSLAVGGVELPDELPFNHYIRYWGPDYKLHINPMAERVNQNSREDLQRTETQLLQQLKELAGAPSIPYGMVTGRDSLVHGWRSDRQAENAENAAMDASSDGAMVGRQHASEFFAGNKDQDGANGMGIVRPRPTMSIMGAARNNNEQPAAAAAQGSAAMEQ